MRTTLACVALLATGCMGQAPYEGVWLIQLDQAVLDEATYECAENFSDARCPEAGGPVTSEWTYTSEQDVSPYLTYAQVVQGPGKEIYLTLMGEIFVGQRDGPDMDFEWQHTERNDDTDTHETGYTYRQEDDETFTTRVRLTRTGQTIEGSVEYEFSSEQVWTETDEWEFADVGIGFGQIPANAFLVPENPGDEDNYSDEDDCDGPSCTLQIRDTVVYDRDLVGTRTSYEEDAYDGVDQADQQEGVDVSL